MNASMFSILSLTSLIAGSCSSERRLPVYETADFTPRWDVGRDDVTGHRVRPFLLIDKDDAAFSEHALDGKISIVDFFFTSCRGVCPRMAASMKRIQDAFAHDNDVLLVSHSVTPAIDTPEVLRAYAKAHGVRSPQWKLVTGAQADIYDLGRRSYFVEEDIGVAKPDSDFLHTENFVLVDGLRRLRGIYNALDPTSMAALLEDIALLKGER